MAPSEAERLNIEAARFFLSSEKTVKAYCHNTYKRAREQAGAPVKSSEELKADIHEHMRRLREYFTGKGST